MPTRSGTNFSLFSVHISTAFNKEHIETLIPVRNFVKMAGVRSNALALRQRLHNLRPANPPSPRSIRSGGDIGKLLRVWLISPWQDYALIRTLANSGESRLAYRKGGYFSKAIIQVFPGSNMHILQNLSEIRHSNIAKVYDTYLYREETFAAMEYLELALEDLQFSQFELEEWEMATILAEV
jgi:hypothetical protein